MAEPSPTASVRDVMTRDVVTVRADTPVQEAMELLVKHRITGLPVLDEAGRLTGVVSESDFISKRGERVADIMSPSVVTVDPYRRLAEVGEILLRHGIRRLPVVEAGRLVGLVSRRDLLSFLASSAWMCKMCGLETHALQPPGTCSRCQADSFELRQARARPS